MRCGSDGASIFVSLADCSHQIVQRHAREVHAAFEDAGSRFLCVIPVAGHGRQPCDRRAVARDGEAIARHGRADGAGAFWRRRRPSDSLWASVQCGRSHTSSLGRRQAKSPAKTTHLVSRLIGIVVILTALEAGGRPIHLWSRRPRVSVAPRPRPYVPHARPGPWCGAPGADSASGSRPETRENTGRDRWRQGKEGALDPTGERGTICRAQDPFFHARARPYLPRAGPCGRARQSALSSPASSRTAAACPTESHLSHLIPLNPA